ncbi:hypothetical protein PENSUB_6247 [Penicillium subrubescens]|uniref:Uncharacterized protein n=1 Tax=Penicillium subrubescens TaxID=1316194 RepID=A0A1Q5U1C6_9EURO|nr:hypothetical protein PENSUB_6247 [Penicillium subrubescens]
MTVKENQRRNRRGSESVVQGAGDSTRGYGLESQRKRPLEHWSITPLRNGVGSDDLPIRRALCEVTNEQYAQKSRQEMQAQVNGGVGGMGSLADELEKVKVGLPRSKSVSISGRLVIHQESGAPTPKSARRENGGGS